MIGVIGEVMEMVAVVEMIEEYSEKYAKITGEKEIEAVAKIIRVFEVEADNGKNIGETKVVIDEYLQMLMRTGENKFLVEKYEEKKECCGCCSGCACKNNKDDEVFDVVKRENGVRKAIKWTGNNLKQLMDFVGEQVIEVDGKAKDRLTLCQTNGMRKTFIVGNYIVEGNDGVKRVVNPDVFQELYKEA